MPRKINDRYRAAAEEFARRVVEALGNRVHSIVLYGSVARGEAKRESDVDVLIISPEPDAIRSTLSTLRNDFSYERNYDFLLSMAHFSREEFSNLVRLRSPFIRNILEEGDILYDDGTFAGVRGQAVATG